MFSATFELVRNKSEPKSWPIRNKAVLKDGVSQGVRGADATSWAMRVEKPHAHHRLTTHTLKYILPRKKPATV